MFDELDYQDYPSQSFCCVLKALDMSAKDLSELSGIHSNTILNFKNNHSSISLSKALKLTHVLSDVSEKKYGVPLTDGMVFGDERLPEELEKNMYGGSKK